MIDDDLQDAMDGESFLHGLFYGLHWLATSAIPGYMGYGDPTLGFLYLAQASRYLAPVSQEAHGPPPLRINPAATEGTR